MNSTTATRNMTNALLIKPNLLHRISIETVKIYILYKLNTLVENTDASDNIVNMRGTTTILCDIITILQTCVCVSFEVLHAQTRGIKKARKSK